MGAAVETLLAAALDDSREQIGASGSSGDAHFQSPRICDMAGLMLGRIFPGKYRFIYDVSPKERERQRIACLNIWRAEHG